VNIFGVMFKNSGEASCSEHILCHACFFPWNDKNIMMLHYCIDFLKDGSILPLSQIVMTPSESSESL
jgi:hypothetical protein